MNIINPKIDEYAEVHSSPEDELLKRINQETHAEVYSPIMLSGHLQGRILSLLSKLIQPTYILEIGTYTGYSALCMAEGLKEEGELHTIDISKNLKDRVEGYFAESKFNEQIHFHIGTALDVIPQLNKEWDLVFIDADKMNYSNYYDLVIESTAKGGIIIADNILWKGAVVEESDDKRTKALDAYNKKIQADDRVENVLLPIRDGLMVARKL